MKSPTPILNHFRSPIMTSYPSRLISPLNHKAMAIGILTTPFLPMNTLVLQYKIGLPGLPKNPILLRRCFGGMAPNSTVNLSVLNAALTFKECHSRQMLENKLLRPQQRRLVNGTSADTEAYLQAKTELQHYDLSELDALTTCTQTRYTEEGEKSTHYFYLLER